MTDKKVLAWLTQTSTLTGFMTALVALAMWRLHEATAAEMLPLALTALVGLVIHDKAQATAVVSELLPIATTLAAHPTAASVSAELPAIVNAVEHVAEVAAVQKAPYTS